MNHMENDQYSLIDVQGINYFGSVAGRLGYLFKKVNMPDKTIDGEIELTQGVGDRGRKIGVKIVPESRFEKSSEGFMTIKVDDKILSNWKSYKNPIIMATYSRSDSQEIYWTRVDSSVSTTIRIDTQNKFDDKTLRELLRIVFSYYTSLGLGLNTASFSEAIMEFGQGLKDTLGPLQETYLEAEEMMRAGDYVGARTIYQSLSVVYRKVKVFRLNHALSLYYCGEYENCLKLCTDLVKDYNYNPKLHSLMGNCYAKTGNFAYGQKHLEEAVKLMPLSGEVWNGLGLLYLWQRNDQEAYNALKVALQHEPNNGNINFNMAICHTLLGKDTEAIKYYDKCISIDSKCFDAYNNKALLLKSAWRLGEAISCLEKAIEIKPDNYCALFNIACLLKDMGHNEGAIKYYNRCIEQNKYIEKVYYDLACLYCRTNNLEKAAYYFEKVYNYAKYDVIRESFNGIVEIIDTEYEALYLIKVLYTPDATKVVEVNYDKKLTFFNMNSFMKDCIKALNDKSFGNELEGNHCIDEFKGSGYENGLKDSNIKDEVEVNNGQSVVEPENTACDIKDNNGEEDDMMKLYMDRDCY